ncbi:MAG: hypothetical protein QW666_00280 [Candidatus Woesearchaeota archaeon]
MSRLSKMLALGAAAAIFFTSDSSQYFVKTHPVETAKSSAVSLESITFEEAKTNESKRQQFIDQIINKYGKPHYLVRVIYDPDEDGICEHEAVQIYTKVNSTPGFMVTGAVEGKFYDIGRRKLSIQTRITRMAFEKASEEYFVVGLLSHERTIAKCLYGGFSKVSTDVLYFQQNGRPKILTDVLTLLLEIEAYSADIDFCKQNNLSQAETNFAITYFKQYYTELEKQARAVPEHLKPQLEMIRTAYERKDIP